MNTHKSIKPCVSLLLLALASIAGAHDTWLIEGTGTQEMTSDHREIALALTTGDAFPAQGTTSSPARILRASLISADTSVPLLIGNSTAQALEFRGLTKAKSVVIAVVQLKPSQIDLPKDKVAGYLEELGNPSGARARYEKSGTWQESYSKNAKMWVRVGTQAAPKSLLAPMNLPYELVPVRDPTTLKIGESLKVCAYANGKAAPKAYIGMVGADGKHVNVWADQKGCASFKLASVSGYLIHGIRLEPSKMPSLDWESHFASLTVLDVSKAGIGAQ